MSPAGFLSREDRERIKEKRKEELDMLYDQAWAGVEEVLYDAGKKIFLIGFVAGLLGGGLAATTLFLILR